MDAERKLVLQLELADPRKALAVRDIQLCHIEALKADKMEAADAITSACLASTEADAKRDEAIKNADNLKHVFLEAVLAQKRRVIRANKTQK